MEQFVFITLILFGVLSHARSSSEPSPSPLDSPAPSPFIVDCSTIVYDMADCIAFLSAGSVDAMPTSYCCEGFKSVLDYDPSCICVAMEGSQELGIVLNNTRAAVLPSACGTSVPHLDCLSSLTPATSPVDPPPPNKSPVPPSKKQSPVTKPPVKAPASAPSTKSGSTNLSVSFLFLVVTIVSSFAFCFSLVRVT